MKEPWIILRYDKSKKKLYDLFHIAGPNIFELTDSQVKLGKLEGTAAGIDTVNLPSLLVIGKGLSNTSGKFSFFFV